MEDGNSDPGVEGKRAQDVSDGMGNAVLLKTNRLSDVCRNCKKEEQISVGGPYGTKINVYKCLGHRALRWDLAGKDLTQITFAGADLKLVNYMDTVLHGADLASASVRKSNFSRADAKGATLRRATFRRCNFSEANLSQCDARGAQFISCDFTRAFLNEIQVDERTDFVDCDFTGTAMRFVQSRTGQTLRGSKTRLDGIDLRGSTGTVPTEDMRTPGLWTVRRRLQWGRPTRQA